MARRELKAQARMGCSSHKSRWKMLRASIFSYDLQDISCFSFIWLIDGKVLSVKKVVSFSIPFTQ